MNWVMFDRLLKQREGDSMQQMLGQTGHEQANE